MMSAAISNTAMIASAHVTKLLPTSASKLRLSDAEHLDALHAERSCGSEISEPNIVISV